MASTRYASPELRQAVLALAPLSEQFQREHGTSLMGALDLGQPGIDSLYSFVRGIDLRLNDSAHAGYTRGRAKTYADLLDSDFARNFYKAYDANPDFIKAEQNKRKGFLSLISSEGSNGAAQGSGSIYKQFLKPIG